MTATLKLGSTLDEKENTKHRDTSAPRMVIRKEQADLSFVHHAPVKE